MGTIKASSDERLRSFFAIMQDELVLVDDENKSFAVQRQKARLRKKACFSNSLLSELAIQTFVVNNSSVTKCHSVNQCVIENARYFVSNLLMRYSKRLDPESIQETLVVNSLFDFWRYGPGASNGVTGTHTAQKISQKMTVTNKCVPFIKMLRSQNAYFSSFDAANGDEGYSIVEGSRLATVQKNEDTDRTIAIEPSGNMAMQLAAGCYLEGALRCAGLDISCQQDYNNLLALSGSMTNGLATIDLRAASDMISLDLVRSIMPEDWYILLTCIRSEFISVKGHDAPILLNMISTMGNGYTFPLMTLIIVSLIYGYRCSIDRGRNLSIDWSSTSVFGDDIIIPSDEVEGFCAVLGDAGLVVNFDKSYSDGPFRESCGGDYYRGYDVTPFYVKSLATDSDVYVAINQLLGWSAKHYLFYPKSYGYLISLLQDRPFFIPEWHDPSEGVLCQSGPKRYRFLKTVTRMRKLKSGDFFACMLAVGNYLLPSGDNLLYTPRCESIERKVVKGRYPKGYSTGWDPSKRSYLESASVSVFLDAVN